MHTLHLISRSRRWLFCLLLASQAVSAADVELKDLTLNGGLQDGKAHLVIDARLTGLGETKDKLLFATTLEHSIRVAREKLSHAFTATLDILQGDPQELPLTVLGEGEIQKVTGEGLQDWSIRQETNGTRTLVLRPRKAEKPVAHLTVAITAERLFSSITNSVAALTLVPPQPALFHGYVRVQAVAELDLQTVDPTGLVPIEPKFLPETLRGEVKPDEPEALAFRFQGSAYALTLQIRSTDPEARRAVLRDFTMTGQVGEATATFVLTATARVQNPRGASLTLLSGSVALSDLEAHPDWRLNFTDGRFVAVFDRAGDFPIQLKFHAAVRQAEGWRGLDFRVAPSALQPVTLRGLAPDTQFQAGGAARPHREGGDFLTFLPPDGSLKVSWKERRPEAEGKLFYAAEMLSQISIAPGLMRQIALLEGKVMQGELSQLTLLLRGPGNVTRVHGADVLAWKVEPAAQPQGERRLVVQFNQPQKDAFALHVQMQTELGNFPQAVEPLQLRPENAVRFSGHFRVVNEGAVRLEVVQASGLSQISPDQFPETDTTKALFGAAASQRFAFRFSSADFSWRVQADNILPELSVSELLEYHLGENELALEAELELDIREAPLRELVLRVPRGFALARLQAPGSTDYFASENPNEPDGQLRLVYGQPILGRQVVQLRLERNAALGGSAWVLPRLEVTKAKSTRGHVAVSADAGFRLTPERTAGLTEIATAFFPKKVTGIQAAFRLSDPAWQATMRVERLPQSIQADVFHLFSIGEGIGYGSSTVNYLISGAPISTLRLELSTEYFNVEFTGKDIRNWQKTTNGYTVQLHTPVSGAYTLLATYERPFKAQGDTLAFTGARPLDAASEQGHTIVISDYQFQVKPVSVSPGLLALETPEVPAEYRLFFDAPILAAYRYTARPFNLQLALSPLAQGDTLSLVVDRASLNTRISKDGEVLTDARYFVKNRGNTHFRLALAPDTQLWSATVNGATVVPVKDGQAHLIPLPQRADPDAVQVLDLKLAARSPRPERVTASAPIVTAPVLLAEWKIEPDTGQRLVYQRGSLAPAGGMTDISGFAGLARLFTGSEAGSAARQAFAALAFTALALWAWRWSSREGAYRFSFRHLTGGLVGVTAFALALATWIMLGRLAQEESQTLPRTLTLLAPVQQSGSAVSVEVANLRDEFSAWSLAAQAWPALLALLVWCYAWVRSSGRARPLALMVGWTLWAWTALRCPNGAPAFFGLLAGFLLIHVGWPAFVRLRQLPRKPASPPSGSPTAAVAALLMGGLFLLDPSPALAGDDASAAAAQGATGTGPQMVRLPQKTPALAESVLQEIRVEENAAMAATTIRWQATRGQMLPLLYEPAVLTRIAYPTQSVRLVQTTLGSRRGYQLLAQEDGAVEIEVQFQLPITKRDGESGFALPTQPGLVNRLTLIVADQDVDVAAPQSVSVERETAGSNTVARLVLAPSNDAWIGWKPRSRDVRREKAVFYAELFQLYAPSAGVIEGAHQVQVRPAQGELGELIFDVPRGVTITDVTEAGRTAAGAETKTASPPVSLISLWRFDPDTRKLRVSLAPAQSRPFALLVRSQVATGPLPMEQSIGLLSLTQAAGQVGLVGVATGPDVQLDNVAAPTLSPINLEDFPGAVLPSLSARLAGLALHRAFRYADATGVLALKASTVEPDVRIETQTTLSLGEDRVLLAATVNAAITRAGIFRLSFVLPAGLEVESITGAALSHWTQLTAPEGRVVTLHLKGKTEGQASFAITLTGPGTKAIKGWAVPRLALREAGKQRGQLVIVPEHGLRLQVNTREGVTQLDPQKAGLPQKGVLAFRLLQDQWSLTLDLEQVDPWVQVSSLQHVTVSEAQIKVTANLQYQIENTGLKLLRVRIPTNAESVRFTGEEVSDFLPVPDATPDGWQTWEVKLHRRILGKYLLQSTYQTPLAAQATNSLVPGVRAADVNLQRGFLTVQSGGRLQIRVDAPPAALQPTEWQSIPRALKQDLEASSADYAFRLVEPAFQLALQLERHEATKLLPARVSSITLSSVISDEGVMLTQVRMEMVPGDKRLLHCTLPADGRFWFAFVNQNGVWPWREQDQILIPLEPPSGTNKVVAVELFYSSRIGTPGGRALNLELLGPKFDLPLENVTWRVFLNEKWHLQKWDGSLQLQEEQSGAQTSAVDVQSYLQGEASRQREKTKEAEAMLAMGNTLLEKGAPQQARRAYQAAYGLSTHDDAFNEDARVQLHNLKLQQALVGLNVRQAAVAGEADPAAKPRDLRGRKSPAYTQQEAKQLLDANSAEENAAFVTLAERLIQQQDATVSNPTAIRAAIPEQGRLLTFHRAVQVETWADLRIGLAATAARAASWSVRLLSLAAAFVTFGVLLRAGRGLRTKKAGGQ